jgi:hypothetical protein
VSCVRKPLQAGEAISPFSTRQVHDRSIVVRFWSGLWWYSKR